MTLSPLKQTYREDKQMDWHFICAPSDVVGQMNILRHICYLIGMDGSGVGILQEAYQVGLICLLKCQGCQLLCALSNFHVQNVPANLQKKKLVKGGAYYIFGVVRSHGG